MGLRGVDRLEGEEDGGMMNAIMQALVVEVDACEGTGGAATAATAATGEAGACSTVQDSDGRRASDATGP